MTTNNKLLFLWIRCSMAPTVCDDEDHDLSGEEYFIKYLNPESTVQIDGTQTFKQSVKDVLIHNVQPHLNFKLNVVESAGNVVIHDIHQGGGIIKCMTSQSTY